MSKRTVLWMPIDDWKAKAAEEDELTKVYGLRKICSDLQMKQVSEEDRTIRFVISNESVDRSKDTISVKGWLLDAFQRNPVVPFAHDYRSLPVAKAIEIGPQGTQLISTAQFPTKEVYAFADTVYQMVLGEFVNAVSVGFRALKHEVNKERGGVDFLQQELLEYSIVPVPDNPEALIQARSAGIDLAPMKEWAEQILDELHGEEMLCVSKHALESIVRFLEPERVSVEVDVVDDTNDSTTDKKIKTEIHQVGDVSCETITYRNNDGDTVVETTSATGTVVPLDLTKATTLPDVVEKVDPLLLQSALPESYEWTTMQLIERAKDFLTSNGIEVRENMDFPVPIATYADRFIFCLIGRDRSYADDPCYQGSYSRDKRLGNMPRFKGEPDKIDVQITMEIVQAMAKYIGIKDIKDVVIPDVEVRTLEDELESAFAESPKSAMMTGFEFLQEDESLIKACLAETLDKVLSAEVEDGVTKAMNKLRGRID